MPLLLEGALTLELCVMIELPLNFANIIAFPLLLGVAPVGLQPLLMGPPREMRSGDKTM
jgi:hypothetical protein